MVRRKKMEEKKIENKKRDFVSYLDDDGRQKNVWCDILEKTSSYVVFRFGSEQITLPWNRILKVKEKEGSK